MSQYFPKSYRAFKGNVKVKLFWPSYAIKGVFKKCSRS